MNLRTRIRQSPFSQERVAITAGYDPALFSRYLRGLRKPPDDFEERVATALGRMETAEKAANEARARVLEANPCGVVRD